MSHSVNNISGKPEVNILRMYIMTPVYEQIVEIPYNKIKNWMPMVNLFADFRFVVIIILFETRILSSYFSCVNHSIVMLITFDILLEH